MFENSTDIYVFSGTGNTLLVARRMCDAFVRSGRQAKLHLMERSDPAQVDTTKNLGLAFPVAAQSTYPLVWDFCRRLPQSECATPVFMVDTLAGFSGGMVGPLKRMLQKKGYRPVGAQEIIMPNNFLCSKINEEKNRELVEKGLQKAEAFSHRLFEGTAVWKGLPVVQWLLRLVQFVAYPSRGGLMRRFLTPKLNREKCTRCGICAKVCPVGNITNDAQRYPEFGDHCLACMRCFGRCPAGALRVRRAKPYFAEGVQSIEE